MSSITYLHVHQCEGVVFDDISAMNAELDAAGADELLNPLDIEAWNQPQSTLNGFVMQEADGSVKLAGIMEHEWNGYASEFVSVYSCIAPSDFEIIAKHMTAGKLVIRYETEGWADEYYVLTQGKVANPSVAF